MNKVILMGRIVRDPDVRYSKGDKPIAIARYTLAINRNRKNAGDQEVDYINCVCLGKNAEVAEKYFYKGIRLVISGKIQSGSYINPEGRKIYTTTVLAEEQQFAERKNIFSQPYGGEYSVDESGFINIPDSLDDEVPFR